MVPSRSRGMKPFSLLVVEDEVLISDLIEEVLAGTAYKVVGVAAEGTEAIRLAANLKPEIVLLDIALKGTMTGLEAARQMREDHPDLRLFFSSGSSDPETRTKAEALRPSGFLSKPFLPRHLVAMLDAVCRD
jgi:DNA-binding NarL/FixJ family response regulator